MQHIVKKKEKKKRELDEMPQWVKVLAAIPNKIT